MAISNLGSSSAASRSALRFPRKVVLCIVAFPASALADESMRTTAIQAYEMAPWWVWWTSLFLLAFLAYPLTLRFFFQRRARNFPHLLVWITSVIHFSTGAATFLLMFVLSLGYSRTSPLAFIAFWIATTIIVTVAACALYLRFSRRP